ncbi:MAG: DUF488 domain-containing protein [Thermoplasmata archaeon]
MPVRTKRAYEPASPDDGKRYLVDRLWPRGVSADRLHLTAWRKELAPSDVLRRWYGHLPDRFPEFRRRYREELLARPEFVSSLREEARRATVTLVFGARDPARSNAAVLAELVAEPAKIEPAPTRPADGRRGRG